MAVVTPDRMDDGVEPMSPPMREADPAPAHVAPLPTPVRYSPEGSGRFAASPLALLRSMVANRAVLRHLVRREIIGRYRHSLLGALWALVNPLGMLAVYTLAFGYFLGLRWQGMTNSWDFGLSVFGGLCVYNFVVECLSRSSGLMQRHSGFVRKMVFPVELLPLTIFATAVFHAAIATALWLLAATLLHGLSAAGALTVVLSWVPVLLFGLGVTYAAAVVGAFFRDFDQVVVFIAQAMLFLSPIFYPLSKLGSAAGIVVWANPIAFAVDALRAVSTGGSSVAPADAGLHAAAAALFVALAFALFQKSRDLFADVP